MLTFNFSLSIPFFDKDEGGEESQQRQCSMEEEITQETAGGKHCCVSVSLCMWICICAVCPCLCVSLHMLCLPVHVYVWMRFTVSGCEKWHAWLRECAWRHLTKVLTTSRHLCPRHRDREGGRGEHGPSPDSCGGEQCEGTSLLIPPTRPVTLCCFLPQACISVSLPGLPVSRCPSALKFTPSTPM